MVKIKDKVILVDDIEKIKSLLGKTKNNILRLLSKEEMSCSELAEELNKDQSNIYRQITDLQNMGFVNVKREEKVNYKTKKIYEKSADLFIPLPKSFEASKSSNVSLTWDEKSTKHILNILSDIGFDIKEDPKDDLVDFFERMDLAVKNLLEGKEELSDMDLFLVMKIKLLTLLVELNKNEDVREDFKDIAEKVEV